MRKTQYFGGFLKSLILEDRKSEDTTVSYSQFSMYKKCPLQWKLNYIDKMKGKGNMDTVFGTSMHETIQWYLQTLYTQTAKKADSLDLADCLAECMRNNYLIELEKHDNVHFITKDEFKDYYADGVLILDFLKKKRSAYFSAKNEELVGIELPLLYPIKNNVKLYGFIDLVLFNKAENRFRIIDIKTSRQGWNDNAKKDKLKSSQVLLYKEYFSKVLGVDVECIDVEFFIVKRKLYENVDFPQKRVQVFKPASGKVSRKKVVTELESFISEAFNPDGTYNTEREYVANAGQGAKNCTYCEFKKNYDICPKEKRQK